MDMSGAHRRLRTRDQERDLLQSRKRPWRRVSPPFATSSASRAIGAPSRRPATSTPLGHGVDLRSSLPFLFSPPHLSLSVQEFPRTPWMCCYNELRIKLCRSCCKPPAALPTTTSSSSPESLSEDAWSSKYINRSGSGQRSQEAEPPRPDMCLLELTMALLWVFSPSPPVSVSLYIASSQ